MPSTTTFTLPDRHYKVVIVCLTYNQEQYITDALRSFVEQQTDFDYCALVVDDHSTDRTPDIIRLYEQQYPDRIKSILLPENYYSQGKSKVPLLRPWHKQCDYLAICEGDDYWTDRQKLQQQVDWLDGHPECSMCCTDADIRRDGLPVAGWTRYQEDCDIPLEDLILGSGVWIQTATLVFRSTLYDDFPEYCWRCHVADYPLQLWAGLRGRVHYLNRKSAVYRLMSVGSWSAAIQPKALSHSLVAGWETERQMLHGLDTYSEGRYHDIFLRREMEFIWYIVSKYRICTRPLKIEPELWSLFSFSKRLAITLLRSPLIASLFWLPGVPSLLNRLIAMKHNRPSLRKRPEKP